MNKYISLTKRNCLVFLRDRSSVFFSLLSMLIVLMLMGIFLGNMNVESVKSLLLQYGGIRDEAIDAENAKHLVEYWTLAGILVVNSLTVSLTVIGTMVNDRHENRFESFCVAPVNKSVIALSYISSAILIGVIFCGITLAAAMVYIVSTGGNMLSVKELLIVIVYIFMNVCVFSIIMYLLALFIKSSGAWSGIATVVGTLVGFVGAIYLPMGELPKTVANVLKYIPILHGASLMREVCCDSILKETFTNVPDEVIATYKEYMGITVVMSDEIIDRGFQVFFMLGCAMIAFMAIVLISRRRNRSDR